jgi:Zn-dependent peptidase ImmA (M78 family)
MIGDHLYFANQEKLLPATHAKTARQKFQRAFAQEFLCPIEALKQKLETSQPNEDDISNAAKYFYVSPLLVRTTLVNKGALDREALTWNDKIGLPGNEKERL